MAESGIRQAHRWLLVCLRENCSAGGQTHILDVTRVSID
jgi:hypothetical protein